MELKHPTIIAMKGFPHTGKTSIAFDIAMHLRICVLLDVDEILNSITPPQDGSTAAPPEADKLTALAFDILCGLAEDQLRSGLSVIIDSLPLSRPHLDRLVALSQSINRTAKFIVVDCQIPDDRKYAWQRRFTGHRSSSNPAQLKWYKPRDWYEDVEKLINGYDTRVDDHIDGVSRLFLNVDQPLQGRPIIQAIQALIFCPDDRHVNYNDLRSVRLSDREKAGICNGEHREYIFRGEGLVNYEANCAVCENPVLGAAYTCVNCELALHKSCAEMDSRSVGKRVGSVPKKYACLICREEGKDFSDECSACIFETHLKRRVVPTIIKHECDEHKLSFWAMPFESEGKYKCAACGKAGAYTCYGCNNCETKYHVRCALLPYPIQEHLHGGYKHRLELMYSRDKELENYPCDHCLEVMNPEDWYYHCPICPQTYHLECAFLKDDD